MPIKPFTSISSCGKCGKLMPTMAKRGKGWKYDHTAHQWFCVKCQYHRRGKVTKGEDV
jgi:hypothetical protein